MLDQKDKFNITIIKKERDDRSVHVTMNFLSVRLVCEDILSNYKR